MISERSSVFSVSIGAHYRPTRVPRQSAVEPHGTFQCRTRFRGPSPGRTAHAGLDQSRRRSGDAAFVSRSCLWVRHDAFHELIEEWDGKFVVAVALTPNHSLLDEARSHWGEGVDRFTERLSNVA